MTIVVRGLFLLILFSGCLVDASAQARAWQGRLSLPTYEEGLPDLNPPFDQLATNRFITPIHCARISRTAARTITGELFSWK